MTEDQVGRLVAFGRFREAAQCLELRKHPTSLEEVMKIWVEFELGDAREAYARAARLMRRDLEKLPHAYCLIVAGRALGRSGSPPEGLGLLRKGIALASDVDPQLAARFHGIYVNCLLSWIGLEAAVVELPKLREAATRSGDRRALLELHTANAKIGLMRGWPTEAAREIRMLYGLLDGEPYPDILWRVKEMQSIAAIHDGDVRAARTFSEDCLRLAREVGSKRRIANTLGNLAHIATLLGEFAGAKEQLQECLQMLDPLDPARWAALSTGVRLGLASEDDSLIDQMLALAEGSDGGFEHSYYRFPLELNTVRVLLERGEVNRAVERADNAAPAAHRLAERGLYDGFRLLAAEGTARLGRFREARGRFGAICAESGPGPVELVAEILRVASVVSSNAADRAVFLNFAHRLLLSGGLLGPCTDVVRTARSLGVTLMSASTPEPTLATIGALLKLGRQPFVLAQELTRLSALTFEPTSGWIVEASVGGEKLTAFGRVTREARPDEKGLARIPLGPGGESRYSLVSSEIDSPAAHLVWNGINQLATAADLVATRPRVEARIAEAAATQPPALQHGMVVTGESIRKLLDTTRKLAPSAVPVLITGETGTGKELLARALHDASTRSEKPFIPFNCSAVARDMLDAQLFGYRRGAFTGAQEAFPGVIRAAAGGTLFLDEIGETTLDVQPKLLRFLESGEIHPLGEPKPLHVDVRVVAATNADLEKLVEGGRFREDLFYRLNVVRLEVPPLRERREEIPPLVQHFIDKYSRESHKSGIRVAEETLEYLVLYAWPGNVRQLANEVRRMLAMAESGAVLMPEHLSHAIASSRRTIPASERRLAPTEVVVRLDQPMSAAMEHVERTMIKYALDCSKGRVEDAASRLGLSRKGLYLKRQRLQIDTPTDERVAVQHL
jgi:DNA-binding NtrC family response regulator/tetratricopeptide (TPR) repeat protein